MAFEQLGHRTRRLTTGQIANILLDDEDYIEVLREKPFTVADCLEARISASEAARSADIVSKAVTGPTPNAVDMTFISHKIKAETSLNAAGKNLAVVTTVGRMR